MKKNGPQRSQSLSAFPGSSLNGFGKTTSFRLLTILARSRFTVSHTGSVNVSIGDPKASAATPSREVAEGAAVTEDTDGGGEAEGATKMGIETDGGTFL